MLDKFNQGKVLAVKKYGKTGLIKYMAKECGCDVSVYNDKVLFNILIDLINQIALQADKHQCVKIINELLRNDACTNEENGTLLNRMISCVAMLQIRDEDLIKHQYKCINGFNEETIRELDKEFNTIYYKKGV